MKGEEFINRIIQGDALEVLRQMPDDFVDTIITSPPYWGLRDYGEVTCKVWGGDPKCEHEWIDDTRIQSDQAIRRGPNSILGPIIDSDREPKKFISKFCRKCGAWYGQLGLEPTLDMYIEHLLKITAELKRVLKPTGILFWNHGDSYGGGGNPNDRKLAKGLMIPKIDDTSTKPKCLALQNYRLVFRMIDEQGWILRNIIIWYKPNHMPSSVRDRFTSAYEPVFMLVKNKRYWFDLDAVRVPHETDAINKLRERSKEAYNLSYFGEHFSPGERPEGHPLGKNPGDVWSIPTQALPEAHFATFPEKLIEPMVKAGCPRWVCKKCGLPRRRIVVREGVNPKEVEYKRGKKSELYVKMGIYGRSACQIFQSFGTFTYKTVGWTDCGCNAGWRPGIVLDPFIGSGTTAVVARRLGCWYIGIELNPDYIKIAEKRLAQLQLF